MLPKWTIKDVFQSFLNGVLFRWLHGLSMHSSKMTRLICWAAKLSAVGIGLTTYLIYQHYKPLADSFCNISDYVSCDVVNKSIYAEIFGIPVAALGFATYVVLFLVSLGLLKGWNFTRVVRGLTHTRTVQVVAIFSGAGLLFSFYLTSIEFFVLNAVCIFCLAQQLLILSISLIYLFLWRAHAHS